MNDRERLEAAFAELRNQGVEAHTRWQCCMSCGLAALPEGTTQWVFWHEQDDEHAFAPDGSYPYDEEASEEENEEQWKLYNTLLRPLHLRWGGVGSLIVEVLGRHGFRLVGNHTLNPHKTLEIMAC